MSQGLFGPKQGLFGQKKSILQLLAEGLESKHKAFLSFYHFDDQWYRDKFEQQYSSVFINKSVPTNGIDSDNSAEYVKRLIRDDYLSDASVVIVLVGPRTYCRKHVDWEIYAGLDSQSGGISGLVGLVLPNNLRVEGGQRNAINVPERLQDNVNSGYARLCAWDDVIENTDLMKKVVQEAFDNRITLKNKVVNSRGQMQRNTCGT